MFKWLPKWLKRAYSWLFGYYWAPCVLCGNYYSGREWESSGADGLDDAIYYNNSSSHLKQVCNNKDCRQRAYKINKEQHFIVITGRIMDFYD